jgi:hypothetical protein
MSNICLLAVTVELKDNWKSWIPGAKIGHLRDPAKIAAKQAEWEIEAARIAINDRLASKITSFTLEHVSGKVQGNTATEFVQAYMHHCKDGKLLALNARTRVSQLALQAVFEGAQVPEELFCKGYKVVDPINLMGKTAEEEDTFKAFLKIPVNIENGGTHEEQLAVLRSLSSCLIME